MVEHSISMSRAPLPRQAMIDFAFLKLRSRGIRARSSFSCCGSHAKELVLGVLGRRVSSHRPTFFGGLCFYTMTEREVALHSGVLGLHFFGFAGVVEGTPATFPYAMTSRQVGSIVCSTLMELGLPCSWNGNEYSTISTYLHDVREEERYFVDNEAKHQRSFAFDVLRGRE